MEPATPNLIWVTRSEPGAGRLAERLAEAGWPALVAPVLEIESVPLTAPLPEQVDVAVVLSEHAVEHAPPALWVLARAVIAVGAQTARALARLGVDAVTPPLASSEGLLDGPLQPYLKPGTTVALVSGQGGRTVLREALQAAGAQVFDVQVYRRQPLTAAPPDMDLVGAIVVSSGDGFEAAGRLWFDASQSRTVPVFAPSERVAQLGDGLGFKRVSNCGGADPESVIATLERTRPVATLQTSVAVAQRLTRKHRMSDEQQKSADSADKKTVAEAPADDVAGTEPNPSSETVVEPAAQSDAGEVEATELLEPGADADSDTQTEAQAEPVVEAPPSPPAKKPKSGRGLAFLSLLLALGAAGGAGYLYYELIYKQPFQQKLAAVDDALTSASDGAERQTKALGQQFTQLEQSFAELRGEQSSAINSALDAQQQRLENTEQSLIESLNRVANQAPPSQQQWKLAELEYLLRIANHRVLMEKDADGARRLLETADAILVGLDDFGLHEVRAQLADEILSLKRLGKNDVQGLFLRLEAVKRELGGLPLQVPEYLNNPPTADSAEGDAQERGFLDALAANMGTFFKVRTLETQIKPLLAPKEIDYLELNLRLMLEQAQLGALRGQSDVFEQSLDNAIDWLNEYMDTAQPAVADLVTELTNLRNISVVRELPDISGSLRTLMNTERSAS